jgi:hypothetical protein
MKWTSLDPYPSSGNGGSDSSAQVTASAPGTEHPCGGHCPVIWVLGRGLPDDYCTVARILINEGKRWGANMLIWTSQVRQASAALRSVFVLHRKFHTQAWQSRLPTHASFSASPIPTYPAFVSLYRHVLCLLIASAQLFTAWKCHRIKLRGESFRREWMEP